MNIILNIFNESFETSNYLTEGPLVSHVIWLGGIGKIKSKTKDIIARFIYFNRTHWISENINKHNCVAYKSLEWGLTWKILQRPQNIPVGLEYIQDNVVNLLINLRYIRRTK